MYFFYKYITQDYKMDIDTCDENVLTDAEKEKNAAELYMIYNEVGDHLYQGVNLSPEWYSAQFKKILRYSGLRWNNLVEEYYRSDPYFALLAQGVQQCLIEIIDQYSVNDIFSLRSYHQLLKGIIQSWEHFYTKHKVPDDKAMDGLMDIMDKFNL